MNGNIFSILEVNHEEIIIKVKDNLSNLEIARNPFVNANMDYITVTRGKNHTLTVIYKDGSTYSFNWGDSGYTLIREITKKLKAEVIKFIESNDILLEYTGWEIKKAAVLYNSNFRKWQMTVECANKSAHYFFDENVNNLDKALNKASNIIHCENWKETIAPTGITVYTANEFEKYIA